MSAPGYASTLRAAARAIRDGATTSVAYTRSLFDMLLAVAGWCEARIPFRGLA